jgi:glycine amidinotransferase
VLAHNEWDPLEEVIVGRLEGATIPEPHVSTIRPIPRKLGLVMRVVGGMRYPRFLREPAQRELDGLVRVLEDLGVTVRRPDPIDGRRRFSTPLWSSRGFCTACPRDGYLVVGDELIETPMAWRCRYFEGLAYQRLFAEYERAGARWTVAPRPKLADSLYDPSYRLPERGPPETFVINESEAVFDAADFVRCGRDLFVLRSNVTNRAGIDWLRRHLGPSYRIHEIWSSCRNPMHIDSTFVPLAPGKVLINPDQVRPDKLPDFLHSWDILVAPQPDPAKGPILSMCSAWLSMNVLSIDEKRILVEKDQPTLIRALEGWGFEPVPVAFKHYAAYGGAFHCATLDVRRRGTLESYFPELDRQAPGRDET